MKTMKNPSYRLALTEASTTFKTILGPCQMDLLNLSTAFVRKTNLFLRQSNQKGMDKPQVVKDLIDKIKETQACLENAKDRTSLIMRRLQNRSESPGKVFCVKNRGETICVVGERIQKPNLKEIVLERLECTHDVVFQKFKPFVRTVYVETASQIRLIDKSILQAGIEVFDHTYRSYNGFICFISLYDTNGNIYIVDSIKFRDVIPSLNFLKCGVPKIIHCRGCAEILLKDFKQLGCFRNYSVLPENIFIDWRIRPIPVFLLEILQKGVLKVTGLVNNHKEFELFCENGEPNELNRITSKYELSDDENILENLLKLRRFLARSNDESVYYVMTDDQLVRVFKSRPKTQNELSDVLKRASPLVRQHLMDFLHVLENSRERFSLQRLLESRGCTNMACIKEPTAQSNNHLAEYSGSNQTVVDLKLQNANLAKIQSDENIREQESL